MKQRRRKAQKRVTTSQLPWGGDHGPATAAATAGTVVEPIDGPNPNRMARRRRVDALDGIELTMAQRQAAQAIRDAYSRIEMLSSGSPIKERVQSSPKPDATVAAQVDANSRWVHVTKPIPHRAMPLVRHVCCDNKPLRTSGYRRSTQLFLLLMTRVARHLRYIEAQPQHVDKSLRA